MYTAHLDLLTVSVYSPLHRRNVLITPRQYALICKVAGHAGFKGSQRDLAERTHYTIGGAADALRSLVSLGLISKMSRLGRYGWTRLRLRSGVTLAERVASLQAFVRSLGTSSSRKTTDASSYSPERGRTTMPYIQEGGLR